MRKSLITALVVTAVTTLGASSAQAAVQADAGSGSGAGSPCPAVQLSGNTVTGGCLIEDMTGGLTLMSGSQVITGCTVTFDARMQANTTYYAVNQSVSCQGFGRQACTDDVTGELKPWPTGATSHTLNICLEQVGGGPDTVRAVTFAHTFSTPSGGYLLGMDQTSTPNGIADAWFDNEGDVDEVEIYAN